MFELVDKFKGDVRRKKAQKLAAEISRLDTELALIYKQSYDTAMRLHRMRGNSTPLPPFVDWVRGRIMADAEERFTDFLRAWEAIGSPDATDDGSGK